MDEAIAGTVYGTITAMASMVAGLGFASDPRELLTVALGAVLAIWVGHVYAHGLAESIERGRRLDLAELRDVARRELSIPLAAVGPGAALALGATGLIPESAAVWLALSLGLAMLAVVGVRYARVEQLGLAGTILAVLANLLVGLLVVGLKVLFVH